MYLAKITDLSLSSLFLQQYKKLSTNNKNDFARRLTSWKQSYFLQSTTNSAATFPPVVSDGEITISLLLFTMFAQDAENPSNGSVAEKANGYDIGVLATSTLMGEADMQA